MNLLVIGGTGILSTAVVKCAIAKGINVSMVNRGRRTQYLSKEAELIKADKNDYNKIAESLEGRKFDAIIDFLCYNKQDIEDSFLFYKNYTHQYIFISSSGVYNYTLGGINSEKSPKITPVWEYSVKKWECEQYLLELAKDSGINYTIIRPSVNYGDTRIPYGIVPTMGMHWTFISRIIKGKPIIIWNRGENKGNVTHVDDFAVGVVGLIGNQQAYNEVFNVCGDEMPSYKEMLDAISDILGKKAITIDIDPQFYEEELHYQGINKGLLIGGRALDYKNSNAKLKSIVPDFCQTISLKEGLSRTIANYQANDYQQGIDYSWDGDTDRIINKWCREQHMPTKGFNLIFVNYINTATLRDRFVYYNSLYKDSLILRAAKKVIKFMKR